MKCLKLKIACLYTHYSENVMHAVRKVKQVRNEKAEAKTAIKSFQQNQKRNLGQAVTISAQSYALNK